MGDDTGEPQVRETNDPDAAAHEDRGAARSGRDELVRWSADGPRDERSKAADPDELPDELPVLRDERRAANPPTRADVREDVLADVREYFADHGDESPVDPPTEAFVRERWFDFSYLDEYEEVEREWVNLPYAYVTVLYDENDREFRYHVVEVELDSFETFVRKDLTRILRNDLMYQDVADGDRRSLFQHHAHDVVREHAATVESGSIHKVLYYLLRDFIDYGEIDAVMRDAGIEDVSCDGVGVPVFVYHRLYRDLRTNVSFDRDRLNSYTVRLAQRAGKHISVSDPLIDASLPDGSRIQLTLGSDVSTRGSNFTIRKFADVPFTPIDLVAWNTFGLDQMAYFWLAIENNKSLVLAGGTGSGKTTSMNALSFFVPPNSKVVSIEDTREITLPHDNWIQSVSRAPVSSEGRGEISMYRLLQAALRQRPEYLLVGEIRTEHRVALTFFQAIATGHTAYTTIHADSVEGALSRLQNEPLSVPAQMIQEVDIFSIQEQIFQDDQRVRRNREIAEVLDGSDMGAIETATVFRRDPKTDAHERLGESQVLQDIAADRGWTPEELREELAVRREILAYLLDHEIRDYHGVTTTIHTFARKPDFVIQRIRADAWDPYDDDDRYVTPATEPTVEDPVETSARVETATYGSAAADSDAESPSDVTDLERYVGDAHPSSGFEFGADAEVDRDDSDADAIGDDSDADAIGDDSNVDAPVDDYDSEETGVGTVDDGSDDAATDAGTDVDTEETDGR